MNHGSLISTNVTTVEQLGIQSIQHRESALLDTAFPFWDVRSVDLLPVASIMLIRSLTEGNAARCANGMPNGAGLVAKGTCGGWALRVLIGMQ